MFKRIAGSVAGFVAVLLALLVVGMRWKLSPVLNAVRRLNRAVTNPRVMRTAGSAGTQTSVIHHVGRTSGRAYETPVDTVPTKTGFLIALPHPGPIEPAPTTIATLSFNLPAMSFTPFAASLAWA